MCHMSIRGEVSQRLLCPEVGLKDVSRCIECDFGNMGAKIQ